MNVKNLRGKSVYLLIGGQILLITNGPLNRSGHRIN